MNAPLQEAYIVAAQRLPVGRRQGVFAHVRPDDMLAHAMRAVLAQAPGLDANEIDDVIVGCAMPEAEQGMNVARIALLLAGLPERVPGYTLNRFCASGLQAVADAAQRIRLGEADVMLAGGTETMSLMSQMLGNTPAINPRLFEPDGPRAIAYGMGLTAETVATRWGIGREAQDAFAAASHAKALAAQAAGHFRAEIAPYTVRVRRPGGADGMARGHERVVDADEGPRADSTPEKLAVLKPAFAAQGSVTAGNSSQMSDGAAMLLLASEAALKRYALTPLARFVAYAVAGVAPEVMGIGPVEAIPRVLARAGLRQDDLAWIELNEAFAAQALAVIQALDLDPARVNPLGGAIALGHPLGATGAIRAATLVHGLRRTGGRYGMVSMCVGTGMGAAGVFEAL